VRYGVKSLREIKVYDIARIFLVKKTRPMFGGDKEIGKTRFTFSETMLGLTDRIIICEPIGEERIKDFFKNFGKNAQEANRPVVRSSRSRATFVNWDDSCPFPGVWKRTFLNAKVKNDGQRSRKRFCAIFEQSRVMRVGTGGGRGIES